MGTLKPMTPLRPLIQASMKPPSPLLAPNKGALKPASPLRPKTAPKTPISRPQRRWRFQSRLGRRPQRRWRFQLGLGRRPQRRRWFQPHTDASEQRRHRFQESGPPGLQDPDAIPVAGGGAWPGDQGAADVTNVVKPPRFKSPHEDPCDKRRQSKPKNHHNQRKSPQIDDVCNNTPPATLQRHSAAGVEGAGGTGGPDCGTHGRRQGLAGRPVGGRRYKRRQTNTIQIASRGPLLQTSSI